MLDTPHIINAEAQLAAFLPLTIPRAEIRSVMGPGLRELKEEVEAQGVAITGPWFTHHRRMDPARFDFEICVCRWQNR